MTNKPQWAIPHINAIGTTANLPTMLAHIDATIRITETMIEIHGKDTELGSEYARATATLERLSNSLRQIEQVLIDVAAAGNESEVS